MSAKYASYLNIGINSALSGLGLTLLILTLTNVNNKLPVTFMTNGKKAIVENGVNGND
jgi:hypothetical protein